MLFARPVAPTCGSSNSGDRRSLELRSFKATLAHLRAISNNNNSSNGNNNSNKSKIEFENIHLLSEYRTLETKLWEQSSKDSKVSMLVELTFRMWMQMDDKEIQLFRWPH